MSGHLLVVMPQRQVAVVVLMAIFDALPAIFYHTQTGLSGGGTMRILLTGSQGQLGRALQAVLGGTHDVIAVDRDTIDLEQPESIDALAATGATLVIHPAALTHVDGCARDPGLAYRVNALGTKYVALACQRLNAPLVYISTNEVFNGSANIPYYEYDRAAPINPYGWSKWCGEQVVRELLSRFYIVRVAWLFGGEKNFVRTVLRLAAEHSEITMVADEVSNPTYAPDASAAIARLIEQPVYGTYHVVNEGACSRYALAAEALRLGGFTMRLTPVRLADYPRDSTVPPYTPLHNAAAAALGIRLRPWQEALAEYLGAR
jgi:dTDP-4-dehydrorhamnose reductase